ncbi:MAG TPA: aminotransferase class III-fold pyridoxal phosphate-dependent enzyme [Acidimicrobiia bacterium]
MSSFWHPFANMAAVAGHEIEIERGEGVYVYDTAGRRYLDGTASLWYANIGYGRREIAEAVANQIEKLHAFHTFGDFTNRPAEELAERIAAISPEAGSKVFFTSGGSDSVDTAAKLARRYFVETGEPERTVFIVRDWAYHGMHAYGTSFAGIEPNREGTGPLVEQVVKVPYDSVDGLADVVGAVGPERIAALYVEPVIGAGGVRPAPDGYLKQARQMMREAGALYVSDEVITGFGRVGDWFAANRFSLEPDITIFAKGVTSGYAPLGGVIASPRVAAPFWTGGGAMWRHGYTYSGHSASCVAGIINLDIMEREQIVAKALELEMTLMEALLPLTDHPLVATVRGGVGALAAVQLASDALEADPAIAAKAADASRDHGVITRAIAGGALQASPPLVITPEQLEEMAAGMRAGLDAVM